MRVFLSTLPKSDWWGKGMPKYEDNPFMENGLVPDASKVRQQWNNLKNTIEQYVSVELIEFPTEFDTSERYLHDFVFVRDSFLTHSSGKVVLAKFAELNRKYETTYVYKYFEQLQNKRNVLNNLRIFTLSDNELMEGGEFLYLPYENVGIFGNSRANIKGIKRVVDIFGLDKYFVVKSEGFHLDTIMSVVKGADGKTCCILVSKENVQSSDVLNEIEDFLNVPVVNIPAEFSIGRKNNGLLVRNNKNSKFVKLGNMAINGLSLPGVFISSFKFSDKIERILENRGITHIIADVSEFHKSGGSVHCLTNEWYL